MKLLLISVLIFGLTEMSEAGFRCTFGDTACSAGCVILGHSSGTCDDDGKCWCSERDIDFDAFLELLPSRCDISLELCQGTCHSIGRKDGVCITTSSGNKDCQCSEERVSPSQFAKCAAESTCRLDCQANGYGSGWCDGWDCKFVYFWVKLRVFAEVLGFVCVVRKVSI